MITTIQNRLTIGKAMALGFLLATFIAMLLSTTPPAGADVVPAGNALAWGFNRFGQLGNGTHGDGTESDVPVAVKYLTNVKTLDGGYMFTLAATP